MDIAEIVEIVAVAVTAAAVLCWAGVSLAVRHVRRTSARADHTSRPGSV